MLQTHSTGPLGTGQLYNANQHLTRLEEVSLVRRGNQTEDTPPQFFWDSKQQVMIGNANRLPQFPWKGQTESHNRVHKEIDSSTLSLNSHIQATTPLDSTQISIQKRLQYVVCIVFRHFFIFTIPRTKGR